jgi:hypothetical protein
MKEIDLRSQMEIGDESRVAEQEEHLKVVKSGSVVMKFPHLTNELLGL